ncbi:phage tail protein [Klebsiella michiganensis]|uniref:glycine-rich domain-containing protein n=1 Tax=Klebsiella michiganensis TaxID=1134687 RepID=UPI002E7B05FA|nr:phage tail protein [Klebsiella michiganensis]MEE1970179.1 phage tail protein [Klebsiella michiganensis]
MRKVGSTTDTADANGEYTNGNVANGVSPTIINAEMLNTFQREMVNLVEGLGYTLNPDDDSQILKAINGVITGRILGMPRVITNSGMFTKSSGAKKWKIRILGGGGGSSAAAATAAGQTSMSNGGGAGAYAEGMYDVSALTSVMITIGQGGKGGTASSLYGEDGGTSSVGDLIIAPGGKAGLPAGPANPPFQPVANSNSNSPTGWNIVGVSGPGAESGVAVSTEYTIGSRGANSQLGVGAAVQAINNPGVTGGGYGSGASGCSNGPSRPVNPGAAGRDGIVIIEEYT